MENALTEAVAQTTPQPIFKPYEWVAQLCSQVGLSDTDVPTEVHGQMAGCTDKMQINKIFFEWYNTRTKAEPVKFGQEDLLLFANVISVKNTPEYRQIQANVSSYRRDAIAYTNTVTDKLRAMMREQLRLNQLDGNSKRDMKEEVLAIIQDGWYKYDSALTHKFNENREPDKGAMLFTTPRIFCKFHNPDAGVNMTVDLGMYRVAYMPGQAEIFVYMHEDNVQSEGYYHPHVTDSGRICWGNAAVVMSDAMKEMKPAKAFSALRTLLQTYNDESPYINIVELAIERDPEMGLNRPKVYVEHEDRAWVRDADLPPYFDRDRYIVDTNTNDDGDEEHCIVIFHQYYQGTSRRVDENNYVRLTANRSRGYVALDPSDVIDWS